jgi:hypothetical protein
MNISTRTEYLQGICGGVFSRHSATHPPEIRLKTQFRCEKMLPVEKAAGEVVTQLQKIVCFINQYRDMGSISSELKLVKTGYCCTKLLREISPDILMYMKEHNLAAVQDYDESMLNLILKTKYSQYYQNITSISSVLTLEEKQYLWKEIKVFLRKLVEFNTTY